MCFDPPQQVDDPPVLEPHLVVKEPPELLRQLPYGRLGAFGGRQPVVVDLFQARIAFRDAWELVDLGKEPGQFLLAGLREQEVIEPLEGPALIRTGDRLAAAEHVVEQFSLATVPAGDLLPKLPVELPEVLFHLAEVGEQLAGGRGELLVAVAHPAGIEHRQIA